LTETSSAEMGMVYKKVELVGVSTKDFMDAVQDAVRQAAKTVRGIKWVEVVNLRGHVEDGTIKEYEATVKLAFEVERP